MASKPESKTSALAKLAIKGWTSLSGFSRVTGISYPVVLRMADEGKIATIEVGQVRRVTKDEVTRFMAEGNRQPEDLAMLQRMEPKDEEGIGTT